MRTITAFITAGIAAAVLAGCGGPETSDVLQVDAVINGTPTEDATARRPLELDPSVESTLELEITNPTSGAVEIARVRLEGVVLGLNFLSYDVRVRSTIEAGGTRTLSIPLDFFDLERQASGYLRAHVRTYDTDGVRTSTDELAVDIRGSAWSTMNLFAYALLVLTVAGFVKNGYDIAKGRMPPNRFHRGVRFLVPGLGLGLLLSVAFSVLRVFPLPAAGWIPLTLLPAIGAFAFGYLATPGADEDEPAWDPDDATDADDDDLLDSVLGDGDNELDLAAGAADDRRTGG